MLTAWFDFTGDILDLQTAFYWSRDANIEGTETSRGVFKSPELANELCGQFLESRNMANLANLDTAIMLYREGIASRDVSIRILMKPFLGNRESR